MHRCRMSWIAAFLSLSAATAPSVAGQEPEPVPRTGEQVAADLRANGHLWPQKFGRDDEGRLTVHFFADSGDPQQAAFRLLLGEHRCRLRRRVVDETRGGEDRR